MIRVVLARMRTMFGAERHDARLDAEVRDHLDRLAADHERRGLSREQACAAARRDFGGVGQMKEEYRDQQGCPFLEDLLRDLRHAWRGLVRSLGFTAVAVFTLAIGIAAPTAMFSVCDALLLRALPYQGSGRLVALQSVKNSAPDARLASPMDLADWQAHTTSFDAIAGYRWRTVDLTGGSHSERLEGLSVTPEFFKVFGLTRVIGRTFTAQDRGSNTIVLSRGVWEGRFAADRALVGSPLDVNMINLNRVGVTPHLLLGVVPIDVHFPPLTADFNHGAVNAMAVGGVDKAIDFWLPIFPGQDPKRDDRTLDVIARLRTGVTLPQAQADMDVVARSLADAFPATNRDWTVHVVPLRDAILGATRQVVLLLLIASVLVLIIACGNVSTLLLARVVARQSEVAVRLALGASRFRIARLFLIESLLVALAATAVSVGVVSVGLRVVLPWLPSGVPLIHGVGVNGVVLTFAIAVAVLAACGVALMPAGMATGSPAVSGLNMRGRSTGRRRHRAIDTLVVAQIGLTMVLLLSTGLLFTSAARLMRVEPGFTSRNILTMTISLPNNKFEWQHNVVFSRDVVAAVKTNPLVADAAVVQGVPMRPGGFWTPLVVEGMPATDPGDLPVARQRVISRDYFRVMQIPVLEGRTFDARDGEGERGHPKFVIVGRRLAVRFWPGRSAVGRRIHIGGDWVTIAGVVGDVRYASLDAPLELDIYLPEALFPQSAITLVVRTTTSPLIVATDIRGRIARIDREAFVTDVRTMDGLIADSLAPRSSATLLLALCGGVGLCLALSGIYSIVAQAVVQRRFEIGVRLALGSTSRGVVRLMLHRAMSPVAAGIVTGLIVMLGAARVLSRLLFDTPALDPPTLVTVTTLFAIVAFVAAWLPARRATKVDPVMALRCD
ncbi:MAG TPA: ABC transporter permease [Vicinamibacterales bacterium]|nr:ABC transporter permease [Vicinamibacterales bacterium]